jgi:hypothetical protein
MKRFLFPALMLCVIAIPAHGQRKFREVDLRVNGISSGSSYTAVLAAFGKPSKQTVERTEKALSCMDSDETYRTLYYPGLVVEVLELGGNRKPTVVAFTVTSTKWRASGIRIGSPPIQLERRFGKPNSIDRKAGRMIYDYVTPGNLGSVNFEFRKARLVRMLMAETLC